MSPALSGPGLNRLGIFFGLSWQALIISTFTFISIFATVGAFFHGELDFSFQFFVSNFLYL